MNKRKIENLRKVAQPEVAKSSVLPGVDEEAVKRRLERFYAARLSTKDFDRTMLKPEQSATLAFDEAVVATKVWAHEVNKAFDSILMEIWK